MSHEQTGLFMVRAWYEDGSAAPLRATIRLTANVAAGIEKELTVCDPDALCEQLRAWLEAVHTQP